MVYMKANFYWITLGIFIMSIVIFQLSKWDFYENFMVKYIPGARGDIGQNGLPGPDVVVNTNLTTDKPTNVNMSGNELNVDIKIDDVNANKVIRTIYNPEHNGEPRLSNVTINTIKPDEYTYAYSNCLVLPENNKNLNFNLFNHVSDRNIKLSCPKGKILNEIEVITCPSMDFRMNPLELPMVNTLNDDTKKKEVSFNREKSIAFKGKCVNYSGVLDIE